MIENVTVEYLSKKGTVLEYVLNGISDGIYIVDPQKKIIFWNKGAEDLTGYKEQEVLGYRCSEQILNHIDEDGIPICKSGCPLQETIVSGNPTKMKVYPLHKSGKRFPVMAHVSPIKSIEGNIIAVVEVFRDISKEEELRMLQEKFKSYISKYVSSATVERVMEQVLSGDEVVSRKRELSVLYLDIVHFSEFFETNTPEQITKLLNDVFDTCDHITKEFYGDIDKFIGDAVMAVFIDANDAVAAGEKIIETLKELNIKRALLNEKPVNVRIAINSGQVIQAELGTSKRKDLTVIGDMVNTVVYLEKLASPNSIYITESTLSRMKDTADFHFEKRISVKGKKEPISIYSLQKKYEKKEANIS